MTATRQTTRERIDAAATAHGWTKTTSLLGVTRYDRNGQRLWVTWTVGGNVNRAGFRPGAWLTGETPITGRDKAGQVIAELGRDDEDLAHELAVGYELAGLEPGQVAPEYRALRERMEDRP